MKSGWSVCILFLIMTFTVKLVERATVYRVVVNQRVAEFTRHDVYNEK